MLVENDRPISALPSLSKTLEKINYNRLYKHLVQNNILHSKEFGFQQGQSMEHAIAQLANVLLTSFEEDRLTLGF